MKVNKLLCLLLTLGLSANPGVFVNADESTEISSWDCRIKEIDNVFDDDGLYLGKNITVIYRTDPDEDFKPLKCDDPLAEGILLSNYELLEEKIRIINDETVEQNNEWYNLILKCKEQIIPVDKYPESVTDAEQISYTKNTNENNYDSAWDCRIKEDDAVYDENGIYIGKNITIEYREKPDEAFKLLKYDDAMAEGVLMSNYELLEEKLIIINGETVEPNSGWYNLIQKCQKNLIPVDKYPEASDNEFNWLPSTEDEFTEFQKKYGPVALINGYIVMSVDPEDNHGLVFDEYHEGTASYSVVKYHNACNMENVEPGSSYNPIKVYKINSPGVLMLSWKKQEYKEDNLETVWESKNYYSASEELTVKEISEDEYKDSNILTLGDINADGKVDLTDLSELSLTIIGDKTLSESQIKAADIDENGKADLPDLARLRQYLSKVITSLR